MLIVWNQSEIRWKLKMISSHLLASPSKNFDWTCDVHLDSNKIQISMERIEPMKGYPRRKPNQLHFNWFDEVMLVPSTVLHFASDYVTLVTGWIKRKLLYNWCSNRDFFSPKTHLEQSELNHSLFFHRCNGQQWQIQQWTGKWRTMILFRSSDGVFFHHK